MVPDRDPPPSPPPSMMREPERLIDGDPPRRGEGGVREGGGYDVLEVVERVKPEKIQGVQGYIFETCYSVRGMLQCVRIGVRIGG